MDVNFQRPSTDDVQRTASASFCSPAQAIYGEQDIEEAVDIAIESIQSRSDTFESYGSGWVVNDIKRFSVDTAVLDVIGGSSYIPLPPHLAKKKAILNIQNRDQNCFAYSVLAHMHPLHFTQNALTASKYVQYLPELNMHGIPAPVAVNHIAKFEKQNPRIGVNVLCYEEEDRKVVPLRVTKNTQREFQVNLLLLSGVDKTG